MIDVLDRIEYFAENAPDRMAFTSADGQINYRQLWEASKDFAKKIDSLR